MYQTTIGGLQRRPLAYKWDMGIIERSYALGMDLMALIIIEGVEKGPYTQNESLK